MQMIRSLLAKNNVVFPLFANPFGASYPSITPTKDPVIMPISASYLTRLILKKQKNFTTLNGSSKFRQIIKQKVIIVSITLQTSGFLFQNMQVMIPRVPYSMMFRISSNRLSSRPLKTQLCIFMLIGSTFPMSSFSLN